MADFHETDNVDKCCIVFFQGLISFSEQSACKKQNGGHFFFFFFVQQALARLTLKVLVTTLDELGHFLIRIITAQWEGMGDPMPDHKGFKLQ